MALQHAPSPFGEPINAPSPFGAELKHAPSPFGKPINAPSPFSTDDESDAFSPSHTNIAPRMGGERTTSVGQQVRAGTHQAMQPMAFGRFSKGTPTNPALAQQWEQMKGIAKEAAWDDISKTPQGLGDIVARGAGAMFVDLPIFAGISQALTPLGLGHAAASALTFATHDAAMEAAKEGSTAGSIALAGAGGAATGATIGGIGSIPVRSPLGVVSKFLGSAGALTASGAIKEWRLPTADEIVANVILLGGLEGPRMMGELSSMIKKDTPIELKTLVKEAGEKLDKAIQENPRQVDAANIEYQNWLKTHEVFNAPKEGAAYAENIRLTRFTDPEVRQTIKDIVSEKTEIGKTPRVGAGKQRQIAKGLEDKIVDSIYDAEEGSLAGAVIKTGDDLASAIMKNIGQKSVDEFRATVEPYIKKTRKVSAEIGRGLEAHKRTIKARREAIGAINEKISELKQMGASKEAINKLKEVKREVKLGKELDPTFMNKTYELFLNSILSNPETHFRNVVSNLVFAAMATPEKVAAAAFDVPASWFTGKRTTYFAEAKGQVKGAAKAISPKSWGEIKIEKGSKVEREAYAIKGLKGKVVRTPTKLLEVEDNVFKHLAGMMEREASAIATAKGEGLKGEAYKNRVRDLILNPTKQMQGRMSQEQLYRTFQKEADVIAQQLMSARRAIPGVRYVAPFIRTPVNIFKASIERTPAGYALAAYRAKKNAGYGQAEAVGDIGKATVGSAVCGTIAMLWAKGKITGNAPKDKNKRDRFYREGKQPNSILVGDKWVPTGRIEPYGTATALVVNLIQDYAENNKDLPQDKVIALIDGMGKTFTQQPYMSGMRDILNAIETPSDYGTKFAKNIATGIVPFSGGQRFAAKIVDPTLREPEKDKFIKGTIETLMTNTPGLSKYVPARMNVFGEEITRSKSQITEAKTTKLDSELDRLDIEVKFPSRSFGSYKLDREDARLFQKTVGNVTKQVLDGLVNDSKWEGLNDYTQKQIIIKAQNNIRQNIRNQTRKKIFVKKLMEIESQQKRELFLKDVIEKGLLTKSMVK